MYDGYAEGDEDPYDVEEPEYDGEDEEGWEDDGDQGDFVMDADYLPGGDKYEGPTAGGSDHAGKVKLPAAAKLEGKDAHIDKLLEEYYQLNFEGFAGAANPVQVPQGGTHQLWTHSSRDPAGR